MPVVNEGFTTKFVDSHDPTGQENTEHTSSSLTSSIKTLPVVVPRLNIVLTLLLTVTVGVNV